MRSPRKYSNKLTIALIITLFITSSCKVERNSIVGVWKPVTMILPEKMKKNERESKTVYMTFEQSKNMLYHFHADSTFSLEAPKDEKGFQEAAGTYSIKGRSIAISIYNTILKSDIVKLTDKEMHVQSTDSITIIYEKVRND
jgi:hypothetical protein